MNLGNTGLLRSRFRNEIVGIAYLRRVGPVSIIPICAMKSGFFLSFLFCTGLAANLGAASFNVASGTDTAAKTLGAGETGTVAAGATLAISGGTTAITLSATGGTTNLNNSGDILQNGTGRDLRNNTSGTPTFSIINNEGARIRSADADTLRADVAGSNWTVQNRGLIQSLNASGGGAQAIDFDAVTTGTIRIVNFATGSILSSLADTIRPGAGAVILNIGTIAADPGGAGASSDGIDTQSRSGVQVTNSGSISGRHGITGGESASSYSLVVTNNPGGTITALNGSGINTDGALSTDNQVTVFNEQGATIRGGLLSGTVNGDGDGVDVDGRISLNNSGDILALGAKGVGSDGLPNNPDGVAAGGGFIANFATGRIIGSSLAADAPNGDPTRDGHGILIDNSGGGSAIARTIIMNEGLIQGRSGYGIRLIGDFADTLTNNAGGTIRGANNSTISPVIQAGGGDDTLTNAGTIQHDGGSGQTAIAMEAGDDTVTITGGSASVTGGIDGGSGGETDGDTLRFDLGSAGAAFTYGGAITNFESVQARSGRTFLNGASTYLGATTVGGAGTTARLELNGSQTGSAGITVSDGGTLAGTGDGTLNDAGSLLTVQAGGALAPGSETGRGRLSLALGSVQLDGALVLVFDGTAAGSADGYDQFRMTAGNTGTFALGAGSTLDLSVNFTPTQGTVFTLVDLADPAALISGTFAGLAEGAEVVADGSRFRISYAGGTGSNDLTLTVVPEPGCLGLLMLGGGLLMARRRRWRVPMTNPV